MSRGYVATCVCIAFAGLALLLRGETAGAFMAGFGVGLLIRFR